MEEKFVMKSKAGEQHDKTHEGDHVFRFCRRHLLTRGKRPMESTNRARVVRTVHTLHLILSLISRFESFPDNGEQVGGRARDDI